MKEYFNSPADPDEVVEVVRFLHPDPEGLGHPGGGQVEEQADHHRNAHLTLQLLGVGHKVRVRRLKRNEREVNLSRDMNRNTTLT